MFQVVKKYSTLTALIESTNSYIGLEVVNIYEYIIEQHTSDYTEVYMRCN